MVAFGKIPPALSEKIGRFPTTPGVYIMKAASSRILYIGKAVNLRARVRSYFGGGANTRIFHQFLVGRVAEVDCIVAQSEGEALILENNLIKKHRPVYNIRLKDDKTYVSVKVTLAEKWPRVHIVRRYKQDGNLYFGPYGAAGAVREMLRVIKTVFPLRTCSNAFFANRTRACIEYEINRCTAPCVDLIGRKEYMEDVAQVILFLKGKNKDLLRTIKKNMEEASAARQYELAARYRDQIHAIKKVFETQKAQDWGLGDLDVFAIASEGDLVLVEEMLIREGKIINSHCHPFRTSLELEEVMASFLSQFYLRERYIPPGILCNINFPERSMLAEWLREKRGIRVDISVPERGDKAKLMQLASKNAANFFTVQRTKEEQLHGLLKALQSKLHLAAPPRRIECFDISNFQGALAVGAMVCFEDGLPVKERYRKFRIQTVVGADDFRCMREVLERRLQRGLKSDDLPNLLVIDGGKGQLGVATALLEELGLSGRLQAISIAKERRARGTSERVFIAGRAEALPLPQDAPESLLLQRIRDEAHRFAIRYHRELRKKVTLRTGLEDIPGIGKKRQRALLDSFGTLRTLRQATAAEIAKVVGTKLAGAVYEKLCAEKEPGKRKG